MDTRGPEADVLEVGLRARALTDFFAELSPRTFADLVDAGLLDGAELGRARTEWDAAMLHACVRGVVSLPHGYGHNRAGIRMDIARKHAGVSCNDLVGDALDLPSGTSVVNGVPVQVEALPA